MGLALGYWLIGGLDGWVLGVLVGQLVGHRPDTEVWVMRNQRHRRRPLLRHALCRPDNRSSCHKTNEEVSHQQRPGWNRFHFSPNLGTSNSIYGPRVAFLVCSGAPRPATVPRGSAVELDSSDVSTAVPADVPTLRPHFARFVPPAAAQPLRTLPAEA